MMAIGLKVVSIVSYCFAILLAFCNWHLSNSTSRRYFGQCQSSPCYNGGLCTEANDGKSFICICPEQYEGTFCEKELSISERCKKNPSLIIPHENCNQFYNCSVGTYLRVRSSAYVLEKYLSECPYPEQFSVDTKSCKNFTDVVCGSRVVKKSGCNYVRNKCVAAHCVPCYVYLPSCEGYTNGLHRHGYFKSDSPRYMICYDERTVHTGTCPYDKVKEEWLFPIDGKCTYKDVELNN